MPGLESLRRRLRGEPEEEEERPWYSLDLPDLGRALVAGVGDAARSGERLFELLGDVPGSGSLPPPVEGLRFLSRAVGEEGHEALREPLSRLPEPEPATFTGEDKRPIQALLQGGLRALPQMAAVAGATLAGGPLAGGVVGGSLAAGAGYGEARERGVEPQSAALKGLAEGSVIAPLEALGGKVAASALRGLSSPIRSAVAEGATEVPQEIVSMLAEAVTGKELAQGEATERLIGAGTIGAFLGGGVPAVGRGSAAAAAEIGRRRGLASVAKAEAMIEDLDALNIMPDEYLGPDGAARREVIKKKLLRNIGEVVRQAPHMMDGQKKIDSDFARLTGKPEVVGDSSISDRIESILDRAYDMAINDEEAPVRQIRRGLYEKYRSEGMGKRAASMAARKRAEDLGDTIRLTRSQHGVAMSPLLHGTRVLSDDASPVIEAYGRIRSGIAEEVSSLEQSGDMETAESRRQDLDKWNIESTGDGNWIETGQSMADIFHGMSPELQSDLKKYMVFRRHLELADRAAAGDDIEIAEDPAGIRDNVELLSEKWAELPGGIDKLALDVTDWLRKAALDPLLESGRISVDEYVNIYDKNQRYTPFYRIDQELQRLTGPDPDVPKAARSPRLKVVSKGLSEDAKISEDVFETMVARVMAVQKFATRQRVKNRLAQINEFENLDGDVQRSTENIPPGGKLPPGTFEVWRDGQREVWQAPDDVIKSLENLGSHELNATLKAIGLPARMLRAGATLGLDFMFRNVLRDPQSAFIFDPSTMPVSDAMGGKPGAAKRVLKDVLSTPLAPFIQTAMGAVDVATHGKWSSDAIANGVADSVLVSSDKPDADVLFKDVLAAKDIKGRGVADSSVARWMREIGSVEAPGTKGRVKLPRRPQQAILSPLQTLSGTFEMATRTAVYKRAKQSGASDLEAMRAARESSLDFSRAGEIGRMWNAVEAFSNAEIQDVDKFARALKERPASTLAKAVYMITLPSLAHWLMWHDDEDYRNLKEWEKVSFYFWGKTNEGHLRRFPRPLGSLNLLFGVLPERMMDWIVDKDPTAVDRLRATMTDQSLPVQLATAGGGKPERLLGRMSTLTTPLIEGAANKDLSLDPGRPIVPPWMTEGRSAIEPEDQYFEYTPEAYRWLGEQTGSSPLKIQNIVEGWTGTLGRQAVSGTDLLAGKEDHRPKTWKDVPLVGGFLSRDPKGYNSEPVTRFYETFDEYNKAKNSADQKKLGAERYEIYPILKEKARIEHGRKLLSSIRKRLNSARDRGDWDEVARQEELMTRMIVRYLPDDRWRR